MNKLALRKEQLFEELEEGRQLFVFVHSVADKSLWTIIDEVSPSQYVNLLPKEDEDKLYEVAPFIVSVKMNDEFSDWMLSNEKLMKDAFFVTSTLSLEQFSTRFKNIVYCQNDEGRLFYFGFYTADIFSTYMMYLREHEPSQCKGLLFGIETIYFHKILLSQSRQEELPEEALYFPLKAKEYVKGLDVDEAEPASYLPPSFFEYFSQSRTFKYKEKVRAAMIEKYPDSSYSQQNSDITFKMMNTMIRSASNYGITDEVAVAFFIEANWVASHNVIDEEIAQEVLTTKLSQRDRASLFLEKIQQNNLNLKVDSNV